jgi:gamma-glutamyltranspeptidase/glutathione hydrolase
VRSKFSKAALSQAARPMAEEPKRALQPLIASANQLASQAALSIVRRGGNAVDGRVAVSFASAVVNPGTGNLGKGDICSSAWPPGRPAAIDHKETALSAA